MRDAIRAVSVGGPQPDRVATGHDVGHHRDCAVGVGVEKATDTCIPAGDVARPVVLRPTITERPRAGLVDHS
jgi:hypothetical protein